MSKPVIEADRGTSRHGPSIKAPSIYEALRRKGYSKAKSARISNAAANGTLDRHGHGGGRAGSKMSGSGVAFSARRSGPRGGNARGISSARMGRARR